MKKNITEGDMVDVYISFKELCNRVRVIDSPNAMDDYWIFLDESEGTVYKTNSRCTVIKYKKDNETKDQIHKTTGVPQTG